MQEHRTKAEDKNDADRQLMFIACYALKINTLEMGQYIEKKNLDEVITCDFLLIVTDPAIRMQTCLKNWPLYQTD